MAQNGDAESRRPRRAARMVRDAISNVSEQETATGALGAQSGVALGFSAGSILGVSLGWLIGFLMGVAFGLPRGERAGMAVSRDS